MQKCLPGEDRGKLVSLMFQHASEEMMKEEILSYAICVYSHNVEVMTSLSMNGFGIRCSDVIRNVNKPLNIQVNKDYSYIEIHYNEAGSLLPLQNSLDIHMRKSPIYFPKKELSVKEFTSRCYDRQSRFSLLRINQIL